MRCDDQYALQLWGSRVGHRPPRRPRALCWAPFRALLWALFWAVAAALTFPGAVQAIAQESAMAPATDPYTQAAPPQNASGQQDAEGTPQGTDPPARVARLSVVNGDVSSEPASVNTFSSAEVNQVLTSGDRVYTDPSGGAELQAGQIAVRMGGGTDLTVTAMTDAIAQFGLASGSVHLRSFAIDPGTVLELDTPEVAVTVLQPGDVRVDVDPTGHTTTIELVTGQVQVDGPGSSQVLVPGQRIRIHGEDADRGQAAYNENLAPADTDTLDSFSGQRDNLYASGSDAESPYLSADTIGGTDLAQYGGWDSSDYGPVWYPVVSVGWVPYCHGHWRWVAPWGWTWVESEPWGFAPFHYGRWANFSGRWGWIPGSRVVRPVYAPALVVFAGGPQFSASLGYAPGLGITAWFPLGPREPYAPWYHGSTLYLNRVNASNIYNANAAEVRGLYNQRAVDVYTSGSLTTRNYADRTLGTVAVPQSSFAAGRSVVHARLHLPAETLADAPLLPHPVVTPERSIMGAESARAVPPVAARPPLTERMRNEDARETGLRGGILVHRVGPAMPERPSFEQQRGIMQNTDPGRPLSPAQIQNLRENRPAGSPPPGREAIPHPRAAPPPAPRSAPAPAPSATSHH